MSVGEQTLFRFLHAADLHLDSPMKGLSRYEGAPVERLKLATRRALENLVQLAIDEELQFVLLAGDIYDGDWPDYNTGLFFISQLQRLSDAGVRVFLIQGNHDAANRISKSLRLPENCHLFSSKQAESVELDDWPVVIHGQSFENQSVQDNLARDYPRMHSGKFNIGLLHTSATGSEAHATYAPCEVSDLLNKGYDYWALGHIHKRQLLHESPPVVFSGNTQGRHVRETGPKGCHIVSVDPSLKILSSDFIPVDVARWEHLHIDVSETEQWESIEELVTEAVDSSIESCEGRLLCARLTLFGATHLHETLQLESERYAAELTALAIRTRRDAVWLEKIRFATKPIRDQENLPSIEGGPHEELRQIWRQLEEGELSPSELDYSMKDVIKKLPDTLRKDVEELFSPDQLKSLVDEARQRLDSQLSQGAPQE